LRKSVLGTNSIGSGGTEEEFEPTGRLRLGSSTKLPRSSSSSSIRKGGTPGLLKNGAFLTGPFHFPD